MANVPDDIVQKYINLFELQHFNPSDLDYGKLKYHLNVLETIDVVDTGCISIFDLYQRCHVYYSPKYESVLGWDPVQAQSDINYTNNLIHPDDLPQLYLSAYYYITLALTLPNLNKKDYKSISDYRVKGKEGNYIRVIEQQIPLEVDKSGNVWLALSMLDISPDKDIGAPFRGRLVNHRTGELFHFPPGEGTGNDGPTLTNREKEVLILIASGLISKEIADKLFISVNTVNTHRQRIIEKLNVSNTYEALRYAHERGLFG
ncbi:MAG TPA: LuxR C-terminal-related transcriptional regulator [Bacteroidales bacterium]|nr:LuxR C-terminal-related transcriptional regulator [Bacteroidales bacterium]